MLIKGAQYKDLRGKLTYNNDFDASLVKRIYTIENETLDQIRGWQGHRIEQRWFTCMSGAFKIKVITLADFESPGAMQVITEYVLDAAALDVLHVKAGSITAIQAVAENSKLLVMADYAVGAIQDEYRFDISTFKSIAS